MLDDPHVRRSFIAALVLVVDLSCGDKEGVTQGASESTSTAAPGETMDATTGGSSTGAPTTGVEAPCPGKQGFDDCCCFEYTDDWVISTCEATELCVAIDVECPAQTDGACEAATTNVLNPDRLECVLMALVNSEVGVLNWSAVSEDFSWVRETYLYPTGDGAAFVRRVHVDQPTSHFFDVGVRKLPAAPYFTECLAKATAGEQFACLDAAVAGELLDLCVPGFDFVGSP